MHRILHVEDSVEDQMLVAEALGFGYRIVNATTVDEASKFLATQEFSMILLDLSLPTREGYELIVRVHSDPKTAEIPLICLTGRSSVSDKVTAFSLGVDDYIVKPYNLIELKARVDARLKKLERKAQWEANLIQGPIHISRENHEVAVVTGGKRRELDLTPIEFKLLTHLAKQPDRVFSRDQLLIAAWGSDSAVFERAVDVHICSLRKKLGGESYLIACVPGVGYKFSTRQRDLRPVQIA